MLAYQARNIFAGNQFTDNGAFQFFGSGVEQVIAGNIGRRMGGFMAVTAQALYYHLLNCSRADRLLYAGSGGSGTEIKPSVARRIA